MAKRIDPIDRAVTLIRSFNQYQLGRVMQAIVDMIPAAAKPEKAAAKPKRQRTNGAEAEPGTTTTVQQ